MQRRLALTHFILLFFASNLCLELSDVETSRKKTVVVASESISIPNVSLNVDEAPDAILEDSAKLESSLDEFLAQEKEMNSNNFEISNATNDDGDGAIIDTNEVTESVIDDAVSTEIVEGTFADDVNVSNGDVNEINVSETLEENVDVVSEKNITEDIPSFAEFAQKRLEEVEKNEQINSSLKHPATNGKAQNAKLRWKNYASLDCGAKVVAANPEATSPGSILSPSTDEYKLNKCTDRIWFVVELCEAIQITKIDLANYELFSSSPKDFTVSVSDRYPTREWSLVGKFTAKDERDIQSFDFNTELFGKYVKIEVKSHYGSEHYCPISLFRAYGTSVFEVLQKEDPAHVNNPEDDDDDDNDDDDVSAPSKTSQKNIFNSATDAVMSIVKRAAEALVNKPDNNTKLTSNDSLIKHELKCSSPRHLIVCNDCNDDLFREIFELVSCKREFIRNLLNLPTIFDSLVNSNICRQFKLENEMDFYNFSYKSLTSFFPLKYIGAMCNEIEIDLNRAILNTTQTYLNSTKQIPDENKLFDINFEETKENNENITFLNESLNSNDIPSENLTQKIQPTKITELNDTLHSEISQESEINDKIFTPSTNVVYNEENVEITESLEEVYSDLNGSSSSVSQPAKESIFLRLSNRIKTLERNMSISSQYLEELSKRYKKQVEEMQNLLEKTVLTLKEESSKRDLRNKELEERLDSLTTIIESLQSERQFLYSVISLILPIVFIYYFVHFFCAKSANCQDIEERKVQRRNSVDLVKKERRLSDQGLKIENKKNNKRKKRKLTRSNSLEIGKIGDNSDWVTDESYIQDVPFVLDESDLSALEECSLNKEINKKRESQSSQKEKAINTDEISLSSVVNGTTGNNVIKKEKKGFKKFLKKVF